MGHAVSGEVLHRARASAIARRFADDVGVNRSTLGGRLDDAAELRHRTGTPQIRRECTGATTGVVTGLRMASSLDGEAGVRICRRAIRWDSAAVPSTGPAARMILATPEFDLMCSKLEATALMRRDFCRGTACRSIFVVHGKMTPRDLCQILL